jgi:hypothetical protein
MVEIIRFVSKSACERARLILQARATHAGIFPPNDPVSEKPNKAFVSHTHGGADTHRRVLLS